MTKPMHAPYHFVPLSQWVMLPPWAHQVSHDVPFEDGLSGELTVTLSNITPLVVGAERKAASASEPGHVFWAKDPVSNKPLLPGSSVKGMLRNVLEIASFAKLQFLNENVFAYRDLTEKSSYLEELKTLHTTAGWINFNREKQYWELRNASRIPVFFDDINNWLSRPSQSSLKKSMLKKISSMRLNGTAPQDSREPFSRKLSALQKYQLLPLTNTAANIPFGKVEREFAEEVITAADLTGTGLSGHFVYTGWRVGKKGHDRHGFDYIFYNPGEPAPLDNDLGERIINDFFQAHDEELLKYLKENPHPEYGIPVFIHRNKESQKLVSISTARMPRKPFKYTTTQMRDANQPLSAKEHTPGFDLAECIFGTLRELPDNTSAANYANLSLKSRVVIGDGVCTKNNGLNDGVSSPIVLAAPKASFLNAYLEQPKADTKTGIAPAGDLNNYNNRSNRLKGWKRYPPKQQVSNATSQSGNRVQTTLESLNAGSQFRIPVRFHNLKSIELGALIWCITLGNSSNAAHSLGMGKPYGFGTVKCSIDEYEFACNKPTQQQPDIQTVIDQFTALMQNWHPHKNWLDSPQVKHLLSFSDYQNNDPSNLKYMELRFPPTQATYVDSLKNNCTLINWKGLKRADAPTKVPEATSFGNGVLSHLLDETYPLHKKAIKDKQNIEAEQQREKEKESHLESVQAFIDFDASWDTRKSDPGQKQQLPGELKMHIKAAIDEPWPQVYASKLLPLIYDEKVPFKPTGKLNKKQREKKNEAESLLNALTEKYQL